MDYEKAYKEAINKLDAVLNLKCVREEGTIPVDDIRKIFTELSERVESCKYCSAYCKGGVVFVNEELEEAAKEYSFNIPTQLEADIVWKKETEQHFKDGAKWQLNQMKEALQTEYEKGRFDMREEMIKDGIKGEIGDIMPLIEVGEMNNYLNYIKTHKLKEGDKVKIIIVKED